jgi:hypothetical protein
VSAFETHRALLTDFVKAKIQPHIDSGECNRILIRAPVKSGKREIVEYIAMRDFTKNPRRVHAFVSAFHRVADKDQRAELEIHNLKVFSITTRTKADDFLVWFAEQLAAGKHVVIHLDESDFASGENQTLSPVYDAIRSQENTIVNMYTATDPEIHYSGEVGDPAQDIVDEMHPHNGGIRVEYEPPASFCGPARFLDAGLIFNATRFYTKTADGRLVLTPQGLDIVRGLKEASAAGTGRNILVLRLSTGEANKKEYKDIYQFLQLWHTIPELADCLIYADKDIKAIPNAVDVTKTQIQWSNKTFWKGLTKVEPIIIVIDQTSTRSTEWACHDRMYALHDFRKQITFTTVSQADERVNHYETKYVGGFQPIKVYGHRKTWELSAGRIGNATYLNNEWEAKLLSKKEIERKKLEGSHFLIRKPSTPHEIHPDYPLPVNESEKDRILELLCCHAKVTLSARVIGGVREIPVCKLEFHPCTNETFLELKSQLAVRFPTHRFNNSFTESHARMLLNQNQRYEGYLRGWRVMDYDTDILSRKYTFTGVAKGHPRLAICYSSGILGIALNYDTGEKVAKNTLEAFRSMYGGEK